MTPTIPIKYTPYAIVSRQEDLRLDRRKLEIFATASLGASI